MHPPLIINDIEVECQVLGCGANAVEQDDYPEDWVCVDHLRDMLDEAESYRRAMNAYDGQTGESYE